MNWFKLASTGSQIETATSFISRKIFNQILSGGGFSIGSVIVPSSIFPVKLVNKNIVVDYNISELKKSNAKIIGKPVYVSGSFQTTKNSNLIILEIQVMNYFKNGIKKEYYQSLIMEMKSVIRHELEHLKDMHTGNIQENEDSGLNDKGTPVLERIRKYFLDPTEISAFVSEIWMDSKKTRTDFMKNLDNYINAVSKRLSIYYKIPLKDVGVLMPEVAQKWKAYAKERYHII